VHPQQIVKGAKAVGALVEAGVTALDGLLDHGTPDRLILAALFDDGFEGFGHQVERIGEVGALFSAGAFSTGALSGVGADGRDVVDALRRRTLDGSFRTRSS